MAFTDTLETAMLGILKHMWIYLFVSTEISTDISVGLQKRIFLPLSKFFYLG